MSGWRPPDEGKRKQVGAVVVFDGVSEAEVRKMLAKLAGVEHVHVESFDPAWGSPVFYIP